MEEEGYIKIKNLSKDACESIDGEFDGDVCKVPVSKVLELIEDKNKEGD